MIFKMNSAGLIDIAADVCVYADTMVQLTELHYIARLSSGSGIYWSGDYDGNNYQMNVIAG
jgi:hypothetical protein